MAHMEGPVGQWGPGFAPTDNGADCCVISHSVSAMAAHGCPKWWFLLPPTPPHPTLPLPIPPHPALPPIPPTSSIINTDSRKGRKTYHQIQPSEIEKVSYNKNQ